MIKFISLGYVSLCLESGRDKEKMSSHANYHTIIVANKNTFPREVKKALSYL